MELLFVPLATNHSIQNPFMLGVKMGTERQKALFPYLIKPCLDAAKQKDYKMSEHSFQFLLNPCHL